MDLFSFQALATPLQILLVDLLLGADNALLIGLASRTLPPKQRGRAVVLGIAGAVVLRLAMTLVASSLLAWPLVKLAGALVLTIIALNLADDAPDEAEAFDGGDGSRLWQAAAVIVVADSVMSLDNVVALAAIAQGNVLWLLIGVGLSLPMLGYGGLVVAETLHRAPGLAAFGAALLGWIAGGMAVSDPLWAQAIEANAPGLAALAPALGAAFVYLHGRWIPRPARAPAQKVRAALPLPPRPAPAAALSTPAPPSAPPRAPHELSKAEGRVMLVGILLLALFAGGFLALAAYLGGLE